MAKYFKTLDGSKSLMVPELPSNFTITLDNDYADVGEVEEEEYISFLKNVKEQRKKKAEKKRKQKQGLRSQYIQAVREKLSTQLGLTEEELKIILSE